MDDDEGADGAARAGGRCSYCKGTGSSRQAGGMPTGTGTASGSGAGHPPTTSEGTPLFDPESLRYLSLDYASDVMRRFTWLPTTYSDSTPTVSTSGSPPRRAITGSSGSSAATSSTVTTSGTATFHSRSIGEDSDSLNDPGILENVEIAYDHNMEHCLGYPPSSVQAAVGWWEDRIHSDDRPRVVTSLKRALLSPTARYWSESYRFKVYRPPLPVAQWQQTQETLERSPASLRRPPLNVGSSPSHLVTRQLQHVHQSYSDSTLRGTSQDATSQHHHASHHHSASVLRPEDYMTVLDQIYITRHPITQRPTGAIGALCSPEQRVKISEALNSPRTVLLRSLPRAGISFIGSETIHTILENTSSGLFMMDSKGHPTYMNSAASEITGYASLDEIKHAPLHYAVHYKRPDGSDYPMEECPIDNSNATLVRLSNQTEIFCRKDGTLFPVVWSCSPIEKLGKTVGAVIEFRDVTEERKIEQQRMEADLMTQHQEIRIREADAHKQRMTQFVDYIAHELRNPLHGIAANVDFLRDSLHTLQGLLSRSDDMPRMSYLEEPPAIRTPSDPKNQGWKSPASRRDSDVVISTSLARSTPSSSSHAALRDHFHQVQSSQQKQHRHDAAQSQFQAAWGEDSKHQPWHSSSKAATGAGAELADSPLLADIADSTATATALMKGHDDAMKTEHFSPRHLLSKTSSPELRARSPGSETAHVVASAQSFITSIRECVSHATHITNNVLDLSRLEAGKVELMDDIVHPARVASLAIDMMAARAQEKDIDIVYDPPEETVLVRGDGTRLAQVFLNLLSNAIKFTPANGTVSLRFMIEPDGDKMLLTGYVSDTGVGMSPQEMSNLFQRFGQSSRSIQAEYGGTGLGLSICQEIVQLHGGRMDVHSEKGKGTTFSFTAYYEPASDADVDAYLHKTDGAARRSPDSTKGSPPIDGLSGSAVLAIAKLLPSVTETGDLSPGSMTEEQREQYARAKEQLELSQRTREPFRFKHILVAEDNSINQNIMKTYLKKLSYNFTLVANGQEVIDIFLNQPQDPPIDVILMDCEMPVLDGREATIQIRQHEQDRQNFLTPLGSPFETVGQPSSDDGPSSQRLSMGMVPSRSDQAHRRRRTPIIGLSGNARKELVDRALASGMDDYVVKPFKLGELEKVLNKWEKNIDDQLLQRSLAPVMRSLLTGGGAGPRRRSVDAGSSGIPTRPPLLSNLSQSLLATSDQGGSEPSHRTSQSTIPSIASDVSVSSAPMSSPASSVPGPFGSLPKQQKK